MKPPRRALALPLPPDWEYSPARREVFCPHGVGHGGIHGCDGCCKQLPKDMWNKQGRPKLAHQEREDPNAPAPGRDVEHPRKP